MSIERVSDVSHLVDLERTIIVLSVQSTLYLKRVFDLIDKNPDLIDFPAVSIVWRKIVAPHYRKHGKAIGVADFAHKFQNFVLPKIHKAETESTVQFYLDIDEYVKQKNLDMPLTKKRIDSFVQETKEFLYKKRVHSIGVKLLDVVAEDRSHDQIAKTLQSVLDEDISISLRDEINIRETLASVGEVQEAEFDPPEEILSPWLRGNSITEIYGPRGSGKTWLALAIALALTRATGEYRNIGPWRAVRKAGVLYVDGEMSENSLGWQVTQLLNGIKVKNRAVLEFCFCDRFLRQTRKHIDLTDAELRNEFSRYLLDNEQYGVFILDNLASLFPGLDENSKQHWDPINQWLLQIKALGVSVIYIHHSGKSGEQRGTSAREDNIDNVIKLTLPPGHKAQDGCHVNVRLTKHRGIPPSSALAPFSFRIVKKDEKTVTWQTDEAKRTNDDKWNAIFVLLTQSTHSKTAIAEMAEVHKSYVSKVNRQAISKKLMTDDRSVTNRGKGLIVELENKGWDMEDCVAGVFPNS